VRHHGNLAQKLAETNPAEAKRVFEILMNLSDRQQVVYRDYYAERVSYGLAAHNLAGARQIADTINRPYPKPPANNASADTRPQPILRPYAKARAYALMAEALAGSSPKEALVLLASLFCGYFWGFTWFNRKVEFSLFIA
jgi:hypothetical protein